ncbi:MAG TPA: hypothetical protein VFE47_09510, partial [Tepidisphaeraceae bacterium]|nr:hypothetical protein [Tepidisphaeraceae bacterium]
MTFGTFGMAFMQASLPHEYYWMGAWYLLTLFLMLVGLFVSTYVGIRALLRGKICDLMTMLRRAEFALAAFCLMSSTIEIVVGSHHKSGFDSIWQGLFAGLIEVPAFFLVVA